VLKELGKRNSGNKITATKMGELHHKGDPVRIFAGGKTIADVSYDSIPQQDVITEPSIIVKSRGYIGFEYYEKPFSHKNEFWSYTIDSSNVKQKFIYYYLLANVNIFQNRAKAVSVKIPQLSIGDTDKIKIPIPPISEQERIVSILDKFDSLVNSISEGLPAEIDARRKQYEYYRDKLLTFKPLGKEDGE
jgi:type I restriction enzyme S subunit